MNVLSKKTGIIGSLLVLKLRGNLRFFSFIHTDYYGCNSNYKTRLSGAGIYIRTQY